MKQILSALVILLCTNSSAQVKKTDRSANNLLGPVRSTHLVYIRAEEKFGELVKSHTEFTLTEEYNKEGLLTAAKLVDGSSVTKTTYKYDKRGNLIEKREDEDDEVTTIRLKYDSDGREIELDTYKDKGKLETRLKTKYNSDGNPESASLYYGDGSLKEKILFTYNDKKQLSEKSFYDAEEQVTKTVMLAYDDNKRLINDVEMVMDEDEKVTVNAKSFEYNEKGQVTKEKYMKSDGYEKADELEYDSFGNVIKNYSNEQNFQLDVLTYDNRNNWIKTIRRFNLHGNERKFIIEREVKYY
jgi:YD repeat-containing protein